MEDAHLLALPVNSRQPGEQSQCPLPYFYPIPYMAGLPGLCCRGSHLQLGSLRSWGCRASGHAKGGLPGGDATASRGGVARMGRGGQAVAAGVATQTARELEAKAHPGDPGSCDGCPGAGKGCV